MMSNVLLVARREITQILKLKSFWLTLILFPVALAIGPIFGEALRDDDPTRVAVIDRSGGSAAQALEARFEFEEMQALLRSLSRYAQRYELRDAAPDAVWAQSDRWYTPQDVARFEAAGGLDAALARIDQVRPEGTPDFEEPSREYTFIEPPTEVNEARSDNLAEAARGIFEEDDPEDTSPQIVVFIPADYPSSPQIGVYSADTPPTSFVTKTQEVLTADLRTRLLAEDGITGERAAVVQNAAPAIAIDTPPPGSGARELLLVRSIVPVALSYILIMSLMLSGSWMLQGSVEERSNKLLESLLACISPEELMYGKLAGGLTVGLLMIVVWARCAGIAAFATQGVISDLVRPALEPISSPGIIAAIIFFFLAGYIGVSAMFVAIGAMVDSMSEAQGYMMPVVFVILLPITFLLQAVIAGSDGFIVHLFTWVPLWTPFAVLARLGLGIEAWELIGTAIVLTISIVIELMLIARLFRQNLLATGQKPTLAKLIERFRKPAQ